MKHFAYPQPPTPNRKDSLDVGADVNVEVMDSIFTVWLCKNAASTA
jgi:hypothetical protein